MTAPTHSRRRFLATLGTGALGTLAAGAPWRGFAAESTDAWMQEFEQAQPNKAWTLAYATPPGDLAAPACRVEGRFPLALRGTLFRNGPAGHDLGGVRYHHWFDGDGMIQRFTINGDTVAHAGKFVRTTKYIEEQKVQRRLVEAFGTKLTDVLPVRSPDALNVANTSVLPFNGELLALWEGGSAVRIDPTTLETLGVKTWRDDLASLPFSAHPRIDRDGTVWNFGVGSGQGVLILYQIGPDGALKRAEPIPVADVPMIHDFAITERHLVFVMPPLVFDPARFASMSFLDSHVWRPELATRILVVNKADWSERQIFELPAGFLFHLGNAWEDAAQTIRLDYAHTALPDTLFHSTRDIMHGSTPEFTVPELAVVTLDLKSGRARQEIIPVEAEFPRIDSRLTGSRHRLVLHATHHRIGQPGFTAVALTNVESGHSERFDYGAHMMVEEHIHVPGRGSEDWILGTALDLARKETVLSCFRAGQLREGPVAQARLPYALPLGLHGMFVAA